MELKLRPRLAQDWLSKYLGGLALVYVAFAILLSFRLEYFWEKALIWVGGGLMIVGYWVVVSACLTLRSGALEIVMVLPFISKKNRIIDLRTVTKVKTENRSLFWAEYGHRLPVLVFTRVPGSYVPEREKEQLEVRLPTGRTIEEEEVRAFVTAINDEIKNERVL